MFNKLKMTALAVVTAGATIAGGQAWALDIDFNTPGILDVPIPGCDSVVGIPGGVWQLQRSVTGKGDQVSLSVRAGTGNTGGGEGAVIIINAPNEIVLAGALAFGDDDNKTNEISDYCTNLTQLTTEVTTSLNSGAVGYAEAAFVGTVFTALDSNDGLTYRYTVGFEGVTNTQPVFRRAALDSTSPTVTLSSITTTLTGTDPFTVTATFNEDVSGFEIDDILITNAAVTAISAGTLLPDGREQYVLTIAPTGAGDVTAQVAEMTVVDGAENLNDEASNTLTIGNTIVEDTQKLIADFMLGRAGNLASNQPGLTRFLQGDGCGAFSANATEANGAVNGCVSRGNTWADINSAWSEDSAYTLLSFGAHGFVNPDLLIGAMVQLDYADDGANNASGTGWMVGPYFVAQVPGQPLYFEGRLLYGQTDNEISPLGTYTDSFETERVLAQLRATGEYVYQATTLMPLFDLTYTDDAAQTYTDSLGNVISGQKIALTQITAGMDFSTPISVQSGGLDLTGGLSGIYASTDGGGADFEGSRGRAHLGLNYVTEFGGNIGVGTFYDGIGSNYDSYGGALSFDMKF